MLRIPRYLLNCGIHPSGNCLCVAKDFLSEIWIELLLNLGDEFRRDTVFAEGFQGLNDELTFPELHG